MNTTQEKPLSPREEQIVALAVEGRTNEGIAHELGITLSTVNSYWVRIRIKTKGDSRTAAVAKIIREKAEAALRASESEKKELADEITRRHTALYELNTALALLQLAMNQLRSAIWATDIDQRITVVSMGEMPEFHNKVDLAVGKTISEAFRTTDPEHRAIAAHTRALDDISSETKITIDGHKMLISVRPLEDEDGTVVGCLGVMAIFSAEDHPTAA